MEVRERGDWGTGGISCEERGDSHGVLIELYLPAVS